MIFTVQSNGNAEWNCNAQTVPFISLSFFLLLVLLPHGDSISFFPSSMVVSLVYLANPSNGCRTLYLLLCFIFHTCSIRHIEIEKQKQHGADYQTSPHASSSYFSLMLIIFCASETHLFVSLLVFAVCFCYFFFRLHTVYFRLIHFTWSNKHLDINMLCPSPLSAHIPEDTSNFLKCEGIKTIYWHIHSVKRPTNKMENGYRSYLTAFGSWCGNNTSHDAFFWNKW